MEVKGKRVLVTGGAGFLGSHIVDAFIDDNDVTILDDFSKDRDDNIAHLLKNPRLTVTKGDIRDRDVVFEEVSKVDIVVNAAVLGLRQSINDPGPVHEVNATGTFYICEACLNAKTELLVHITSSEAYGSAVHVPMSEEHPLNPETPYAASKAASELYVQSFYRTYGMPAVIICPFNLYGPRSTFEGYYGEVIPRFISMVADGKPLTLFGSGEQTRDFIYVVDVARAVRAAAGCRDLLGQKVNIATGEETSMKQVADTVIRAVGRQDVKTEFLPPRPGDVMRHCADISKARRMLGFEPEYEFGKGIEETVKWFREWIKGGESGSFRIRNWEL